MTADSSRAVESLAGAVRDLSRAVRELVADATELSDLPRPGEAADAVSRAERAARLASEHAAPT
jgi:hypothetical protein